MNVYLIWHWISYELWASIKDFWQRGRRGYSDRDLWDLGFYVSGWMPEAIRKLKVDNLNTIGSYPGGLKSSKEWDIILEDIAIGFESVNKRAEVLDYTYKEIESFEKPMKKGLSLFAEWIEALWD